jgi:hypothetical protein
MSTITPFKFKYSPTWSVKLHLAGDIEVAKQVCREACMEDGMCVTITPTEYIYTGGQETGYCVGIINYPRFPTGRVEINARAEALAKKLMERGCQWSCTMETPSETVWISRREDK